MGTIPKVIGKMEKKIHKAPSAVSGPRSAAKECFCLALLIPVQCSEFCLIPSR